MLFKSVVLLGASFIGSVFAAEMSIIIPYERYEIAGLPNATPMQFLFDAKAKLIYHGIGTDRSLKSKFRNRLALDNGEQIKKKLLTLFDEQPAFAGYDYTLVLITDDRAEEFCPPCVIQSKINKKVISSMQDSNILLINLLQHFDGERTGTILP